MKEVHSSRFKDAPWFPGGKEEYVLIGGAGGIGSWLTVLMSRAGFLPIVFDFDILEEHNMGGQLYGQPHIGKLKVEALKEIVSEFCATEIEVSIEKYTEETESHIFVMCAYDNMKAREDTFNNWKKEFAEPWLKWVTDGKPEDVLEDEREPIFIDGRLTMEQVQIFSVRPSNMDRYEKEHLFPDSDVEDAPCTLKQTSHSAAIIGGLMTSLFTNHYTNLQEGNSARAVPLFTEMFLPLVLVNIEE